MAPKARARSGTTQAAAKGKARAKSRASVSPGRRREPLSPEAAALGQIGSFVAVFAARSLLQRLSVENAKHEEELNAAVREAEAAALRAERRKAEAAREKEAEKRRRAKKIADDTKRLLELAFDGALEKIEALLTSGLAVDETDVKGITGLSEAASGGSRPAVDLFLSRRADPNSRGEFARTPLWRAAYAGHLEACQALLEAGADPRLCNEQGEAPADVASSDEVLRLLKSWDLKRTDELVQDFEEWREEQRYEEAQRQAAAMRTVDAAYEDAKKQNSAAQMTLARCRAAFRCRVQEHDFLMCEGRNEETLKYAREVCEVAETELLAAEAEAHRTQSLLDTKKGERLLAAEACGASFEQQEIGREVKVKDLNDVLLRDIGGRIASGSAWPLVIDPSNCAAKLLQYAGCAVLDFWRPQDLKSENLRVALLSMIRAGGILALDLFALGSGTTKEMLAESFDQVRPGLFEKLLTRQLLRTSGKAAWPEFHQLVDKAKDGQHFVVEQFDEARTTKFKLVVLMSSEPHPDLQDHFDIIRVLQSLE